MQLSGPEGFGAVAIDQSLLAVDLILRLPGGEALQARRQQERENLQQEVQCEAHTKHILSTNVTTKQIEAHISPLLHSNKQHMNVQHRSNVRDRYLVSEKKTKKPCRLQIIPDYYFKRR